MRKPFLSIEQQQASELEPGPFDTSALTTFRNQAEHAEQQRIAALKRVNRDYMMSDQEYVRRCTRRLVANETFFWRWPPLHDGHHIDYYEQGVRMGHIRTHDAGESLEHCEIYDGAGALVFAEADIVTAVVYFTQQRIRQT